MAKKADIVEVSSIGTNITKIAIDYPSEGLNNLARKINEIIDHLNENV
jgi:hypothetical protein